MYIVAGASGQTGSIVAETLLARGQQVRVIVRSEEKGRRWRARGAEIAVADLNDAGAVARALEGGSGAYFLSPPFETAADPIGASRRLVDALAAAVQAAKIPHVVFLSSIGAQIERGTGPIVTAHHAERTLAPLVALTAVRPGSFLESWRGVLPVAEHDGVLPSFYPAELPVPTTHTADPGRVAAEALIEGPRGTRIVELAGPTDPTATDIAAAIARRIGRPVHVQELPPEAAVAVLTQAGVSPAMAALYAEMFAAVRDGTVAWQDPARVVRGTVGLDEGLARMAA